MVSYCQTEGINTFRVVKVDAASVGSYEVDMIYNNFVEGIIQPEFRALDGELLIYNKINGMKSLAECVKGCLISAGQAALLMEAVCSAAMEADEYMLDPDNLLISIDEIYYEPDSQSYRFIYMPGFGMDVRGQIRRLVEDLIREVVHRDERLIDFMYGAYDMVVSSAFDVEALMRYAENERKMKISDRAEELRGQAAAGRDEELLDSLFGQADSTYEAENPECDKKKYNAAAKKHSGAGRTEYWLLFAVMALTIAAAAAIVVRQLSRYGYMDDVRSVMAMLVLWGIELFIYMELRRRDAKHKGSYKADISAHTAHTCGEEQDRPVQSPPARAIDEQPESDTEVLLETQDETTVLGNGSYGTEEQSGHLLCMSDLSGDRQIHVSSSPTVIGRGLTGVDVPVIEKEISRQHARVYELDGNVYVEDMGSTNGTFVNELRLQAGHRWPLADGDQLRIGEHEYRIQISLI